MAFIYTAVQFQWQHKTMHTAKAKCTVVVVFFFTGETPKHIREVVRKTQWCHAIKGNIQSKAIISALCTGSESK